MIKTSEKIIDYINSKGQASPDELSRYLGITVRAVGKQLRNLLEDGQVSRIGTPPRVFYIINESSKTPLDFDIDKSTKVFINDNFLHITSSGQREEGVAGFYNWCKSRKMDFQESAKKYIEILNKYSKYVKNGLIDGMYKMKKTFDHVYVDQIYYLDFYSIEIFGKTKIGQLLLYAKQSQDRKLISELTHEISPRVNKLIKEAKVDAVGFIPPTVKRNVQFMKELEKGLDLKITTIKIIKVKTPIVVPQKTLTKLHDRVANARDTIVFADNRKFRRIMLVDDALGSGSTINEVAKKIKNTNPNASIIGLAITGSFSGFEIISEV